MSEPTAPLGAVGLVEVQAELGNPTRVQETEPSLPVCKCGATDVLATDPYRCAKGHPLRGTAGPALLVGARSAAFWQAHEGKRRAIRAALITDAGHTETTAPQALQLTADGIAQAALIRDSAFDRLADGGGPLTAADRTRRSFGVWREAFDRLERQLRLVGLDGKPVVDLARALSGQEPRP